MKINFNTTFKTLDGLEMRELVKAGSDETVPITLSRMACNALLMPTEANKSLSGEEQLKRFNLAQRLYNATEEVSVTAEEVALIKKTIAEAFNQPLLVGQCIQMLDPAEGK